MKFLFASDSFKGTISSKQSISLLTEAAKKVFPDCETLGVPVADGGEGTVDAVVEASGGSLKKVTVRGPLWEEIPATYGVFNGDCAIIEMAATSGLPLVPSAKRNPLNTTSIGTGELIKDALDNGYREISIAIGGSATNDGGMGAMVALGVKFLDREGGELAGTGEELEKVWDIDVSNIHPGVKKAHFTVMCDVTNPLTGPDGATYTFGGQKGGSPEILDRLEAGMKNYAGIIEKKLSKDCDNIPGAGAAGGLGAALLVFLNATLKPGIETVLDLIDFNSLLKDVDLCVTGEGNIDWQSAYGKVPSGVGLRCQKMNVPAVALVGGMGEGADKIYEYGIYSIIPTINGAMDIEEALDRAGELYADAAERMFRMIKVGGMLSDKKYDR